MVVVLAVMLGMGGTGDFAARASETPDNGPSDAVAVRWIDGPGEGRETGVTFGVPWPQGAIQPGEPLTLRVAGREIPTQSWPLGFWPDGSMKWSGVAAVLPGGGEMAIQRGAAPAPPEPLGCDETPESITIRQGRLRYVLGRTGDQPIRSIAFSGGDSPEREVCGGSRLVAIIRQRSEDDGDVVERADRFLGQLTEATVESQGPVRIVVKAKGLHRHARSGRDLFPFTLRMTFYAGDPRVRIDHSFVYDADAKQDFLGGVGIAFDVPLRSEPQNRRVWFGVDDDRVWSEPVRAVPPLTSGGGQANPDRHRQLRGEAIDFPAWTALRRADSLGSGPAEMPVWNDFRIIQGGGKGFSIHKSCGPAFRSLVAFEGTRAGGVAALADAHGGLCVRKREFWQAHPAELAIDNAGGSRATVTAWFWSPRSPPSDMRHYTDKQYGALYEQHNAFVWESGPFQAQWVSPYGVGRTSTLEVRPLEGSGHDAAIAAVAREGGSMPAVVCDPAHYHRCAVFGKWSRVSREPPGRAWVEDQLDRLLDHYVAEVDRRGWYGFWDYGDIMHSYDPDRHRWRYDEGGYAWTNTECSADLWLWYSFLRTGRADVFRLASAMSRHNADVDVYHAGPHAGLGSRHNVSHWGCVVKEPRISHAGGRRFLYFLTADEHIGDVLAETLEHQPDGEIDTQVSPGWSSFCWNWLTAWERTGNTAYRDRIRAGMDGIVALDAPFIGTNRFRLDMSSGRVVRPLPPSAKHMTLPFGGPEIWMELAGLLEHQPFADAVAQYGRFWAGRASPQPDTDVFSARLIAYAAARDDDPGLAKTAWQFLREADLQFSRSHDPTTAETVEELLRPKRIFGQTNLAAQWSLNAIECLELTGTSPGYGPEEPTDDAP